MDTARYLRQHSTVVFNQPRGLVSLGYAARKRRECKAAERGREREMERRRAWGNNPDNPMLTAKRRTELLAARG